MALPIVNFTVNVATNVNICQIVAHDVSLNPAAQAGFPYAVAMLDLVSYYVAGGSTGVGTVLTFQELGADGVWRPMVSPAPITVANSTNYNGILNGPFHGIRIAISGVVGNGVAYAEVKGSLRSM